MSWLPSSGQWVAFLVASLVFVQVPGPSLLFTIGRALSVGRRPAQLSVVGNALGLVLQVVLVAVGLGALVAASATAFTALKLVGAVYVVWLGVQAIRHRADARLAMDLAQKPRLETPWQSVRTGVLVGSTNPKTVVFFVAFLPQFTDSRAGRSGLQVLLLGLVFAVLAVLSDSVWVQVAGRARDWFTRRPHRLDRLGALGGAMMVGLGVTLAASD
jgi:threonine/homoserine/homoserine lactone efflux protein